MAESQRLKQKTIYFANEQQAQLSQNMSKSFYFAKVESEDLFQYGSLNHNEDVMQSSHDQSLLPLIAQDMLFQASHAPFYSKYYYITVTKRRHPEYEDFSQQYLKSDVINESDEINSQEDPSDNESEASRWSFQRHKNRLQIPISLQGNNLALDKPKRDEQPLTIPKTKPADFKATIRRPLSPYILFSQHERIVLKTQNPRWTFRKIMKQVNVNWRKLTDKEKEPYVMESRQDRMRYASEKPPVKSKRGRPLQVKHNETLPTEISNTKDDK